MKKSVFLICSLIAAFLALFLLAGCEHEHTVVIDEAVEATCSQRGLTEGSHCSKCGKVIVKQQDLGYGAHQFEEIVTPASCEKEGLIVDQCKYCDFSEEVVIPETGHRYENVWRPSGDNRTHYRVCLNDASHILTEDCEENISITQPTCTVGGFTAHSCSVCGNYYQDEFKNPTDHRYGEWISDPETKTHHRVCLNAPEDPSHYEVEKCLLVSDVHAPTCTREGYTGVGCDKCGYSEERTSIVPATGHEYGEVYFSDDAEPDRHYRVCKNDPGHREYSDCEFTVVSTVSATCEDEGTIFLQCSACHAEKQEKISPLQHDWTGPCSEDPEHPGRHLRTCKNDPTHTKAEDCEYEKTVTQATCLQKGYTTYACRYCTYSYTGDETAQLTHNWGAWTFNEAEKTHSRVCSASDHEPETKACTFETSSTEATCSSAGYSVHTCKECQGVYREETSAPLAHTFPSKWTPIEGETNHKRTCSVCGEEDKAACAYTYTTHNATCTQNGYTVGVCDACGGSNRLDTEQTALGHAMGDWKSLNNGKHIAKCERENCSFEETLDCVMVDLSEISSCQGTKTVRARSDVKVCKDCYYSEDGDVSGLIHSWSAFSPVTGQRGKHFRTCTRCGEREEKDCKFDLTTVNSTCTQDATNTYSCPECHDSYTEIAAHASGHNWSEYEYTMENGVRGHTRRCLRADCGTVESGTCSLQKTEVRPTCTAGGYTQNVCSVCHLSFVSDQKDALGHNYGKYTASENGTHQKTCINPGCSDTISESCSFGEEKTVEATCTDQGYTESVCSVCQYHRKKDFTPALTHQFGAWQKGETGKHYNECTRCKTRVTESCKYSEEVTPATCDSAGSIKCTCSLCGSVVTKPGASATGHSWGSWVSDRNGNHTRTCLNNAEHTQTSGCTYREAVSSATCEEGGFTTYTCTQCNYSTESTPTPAKGHHWSDEYHYDSEQKKHYRVCLNDSSHIEYNDCTFQEETIEATCFLGGSTRHFCTVCGGSYHTDVTSLLGHDWGEWEQTMFGNKEAHTQFCKRCGMASVYNLCVYSTVTHTQDATCTEPGGSYSVCTVCGRTAVKESGKKPALGHSYGSWTYVDETTHERRCQRAGCGHVETDVHHETESTQLATCTDPGTVTQICRECGHTDSEVTQEALNHLYGDWKPDGSEAHHRICSRCRHEERETCNPTVVTEDGTCTSPERVIRTCNICNRNEVEERTVPAGHRFEQGFTTTDTKHEGTCTVCRQRISAEHDFENSNLCSSCGYDGLSYEKSSDGDYFIVTGDSRVPGAEEITIPATATVGNVTLPVKEIGKNAFMNHTSITVLTLHGNLKTIGEFAFVGCKNLREVKVIPKTPEQKQSDHSINDDSKDIELVSIGQYAFNYCVSLEKAELPEGLETIENDAFMGCSKLVTIVIPKTVKTIGGNAFYKTGYYDQWEKNPSAGDALYLGHSDGEEHHDSHLLRVRPSVSGTFEIKDKTFVVGENAFEDCKLITKLIIPSSITSFDRNAFYHCEGIQSVEYRGKLNDWLQISFGNDLSSPVRDGVKFHIDDPEDTVQIPESATSIPAGTFKGTKIKKVVFPQNSKVTLIGEDAFEDCTELETIENFPETVRFIGENAFKNTKYSTVESNWENGVLYIGNFAIASDNKTSEIELKEGTLLIAGGAFRNNTALTSIKIPYSVLRIGAEAFAGCTSLGRAEFKAQNGKAASYLAGTERSGTMIYRSVGGWTDPAANAAQAANLLKEYAGEWRQLGT